MQRLVLHYANVLLGVNRKYHGFYRLFASNRLLLGLNSGKPRPMDK